MQAFPIVTRLTMTMQPPEIWYKDRKRVEEKFQSILATKHSRMSPPTVSVSNPIESVFFRIEKVSKNFASQRFRLRIKPKLVIPPGLENQIPEGTGELNELYSRPIDSRSKPPSRSRSSSPRPRKRARTGGSAHMSDALDEIRAHGAKLDQYQQTLKSMLSVLHQCVTRLGAVDEVTEANQIMIRHNQELADKKNEAFGLRSGAAGAATFPVTEVPAPPKVQRQRSFTKLCLNLDDADSGKPTVPVYIPDDAPKVNIPPVVRQYSQQYLSVMGDGPHILPSNEHFPARIASSDMQNHLTKLMDSYSTNNTAQNPANSSQIP